MEDITECVSQKGTEQTQTIAFCSTVFFPLTCLPNVCTQWKIFNKHPIGLSTQASRLAQSEQTFTNKSYLHGKILSGEEKTKLINGSIC